MSQVLDFDGPPLERVPSMDMLPRNFSRHSMGEWRGGLGVCVGGGGEWGVAAAGQTFVLVVGGGWAPLIASRQRHGGAAPVTNLDEMPTCGALLPGRLFAVAGAGAGFPPELQELTIAMQRQLELLTRAVDELKDVSD